MSEPVQRETKAEIPPGVHCPQCAYDLRGADGETCTECGYSLAGLRSTECRIPWVHRRKVGRFRAYWKTVWMVTFLRHQFNEEYARTVAYRDARLFQWVTILHVYLPVLVATIACYIFFRPDLSVKDTGVGFGPWRYPALLDRAYAEVWPVTIAHACLILYLIAATGVPSYFFHPRGAAVARQNSSIAMSYYACGPLALVSVAAALAAPGLFLHWAYDNILWTHPYIDRAANFTLFFPAVIALLPVPVWLANLVQMARRVMPQIEGRGLLVGLCVPLCWFLLAVLLLVGLPQAILAVLVIITSLS